MARQNRGSALTSLFERGEALVGGAKCVLLGISRVSKRVVGLDGHSPRSNSNSDASQHSSSPSGHIDRSTQTAFTETASPYPFVLISHAEADGYAQSNPPHSTCDELKSDTAAVNQLSSNPALNLLPPAGQSRIGSFSEQDTQQQTPSHFSQMQSTEATTAVEPGQHDSELDPRVVQGLQHIHGLLQRRLHVLDRARTSRRQASYRSSELEVSAGFLKASLRSLAAVVGLQLDTELVDSKIAPQPTKTDLIEIFRDLTTDIAALEQRLAALLEQEKATDTALHRLDVADEALREQLEKLSLLVPDIKTDVEVISSHHEDDHSSNDENDVRYQYFNAKAEAEACREVLGDLENEYRDAITAREHLKEQETPLSVSDEDFEAEYRLRFQKLEHDIQVAEAEMRTHKAECERQGLDLTARRRRSSSDSEGSGDETADEDDAHALHAMPDPFDPQPPFDAQLEDESPYSASSLNDSSWLAVSQWVNTQVSASGELGEDTTESVTDGKPD